jgi:hypothetical protein
MRTSAGRARIGLVTSIAAMAACGSGGLSPSHVDADVDQRPEVDQHADAGPSADVGQRVDEMTIGAARPGAPCAVDSDCGDAYLTCAAGVCAIRYQRPCGTDTDCGPVGFTCSTRGSCEALAEAAPCPSDGACPAGWSCAEACPCGADASGARCEPPFASVNCPTCPTAH